MLVFSGDDRTQPWCSGLIFGDREGALEPLISEGRVITLTFGKLVATSSTAIDGITCPWPHCQCNEILLAFKQLQLVNS